MKNLRNKLQHFIIILTLFSVNKSNAQNAQFKLIQDNNFEKLLSEKNSVNNNFSIYKNFSIQIFYGDKDAAETTFHDFKKNYPEIDATIIYTEPKYKLVIGNYRNKIDAERNLKKFSKTYPNALLVRLKK